MLTVRGLDLCPVGSSVRRDSGRYVASASSLRGFEPCRLLLPIPLLKLMDLRAGHLPPSLLHHPFTAPSWVTNTPYAVTTELDLRPCPRSPSTVFSLQSQPKAAVVHWCVPWTRLKRPWEPACDAALHEADLPSHVEGQQPRLISAFCGELCMLPFVLLDFNTRSSHT